MPDEVVGLDAVGLVEEVARVVQQSEMPTVEVVPKKSRSTGS
jgi:hypothetical protein